MRSSYSDQFRKQCVDAVLVLGKSRNMAAKEYGVAPSTLGRWVAEAKGTVGTGSGSHRRKADPTSQDPQEMAKRIRELEIENEFLKKAAAFFAKAHEMPILSLSSFTLTRKASPHPAVRSR